MLKRRVITAAVAAIGLCFLVQGASAEMNVSSSAPANPNSTFTLVAHGGHGGGGHYGGHGYGGHAFRHGGFGHRNFAFRGRRHFHGGRGFFFGAPFVGLGLYEGGSCYYNCRRFHGPRYCRFYSENYCY